METYLKYIKNKTVLLIFDNVEKIYNYDSFEFKKFIKTILDKTTCLLKVVIIN